MAVVICKSINIVSNLQTNGNQIAICVLHFVSLGCIVGC